MFRIVHTPFSGKVAFPIEPEFYPFNGQIFCEIDFDGYGLKRSQDRGTSTFKARGILLLSHA